MEEELWQEHPSWKGFCCSRSRCNDGTIRFQCKATRFLHRDFPKSGARASLLLELLLADFAPIGWQWELAENGWNCDRLAVDFELSAPSHHERLESHFLIRDWLQTLAERGDVSAQDAELLLEWPESLRERESKEFDARVLSKLKPPLWND